MSAVGQCKTCAAFVAGGPEIPAGGGFCRRRPPVPLVSMMQGKPTPANPQGIYSNVIGQFPPVHESGGCCEWLRKNQDVN